MAYIITTIVDPDDLNTSWTAGTGDLAGHYYTSEVHINAVDKTFHFKGGGNMDTSGDGITGQALYSFFKDRWQDTASITKFDFPMLSITNEQFEFIDGWIPDDGATTTGTDISFTATDTISTAGAVDFTDYFKVGDLLTVTSGSTTNDGDYVITAVTATDITTVETTIGTENAGTAGTVTLTSNVVTQGAFTTTTSKLIRSAGWAETVGTTVSKRVSGIVTLGTLVDNTDQPYFAQSASTTASTYNTEYTGPVNEGVRIYSHVLGSSNISFTANTITSTGSRLDVFQVGDIITVTGTTSNNATREVTAVVNPYTLTTAEAGTGEASTSADLALNLNSAFTIFVRERGKIYADSALSDIGVTTMTYIVYRFPVSNATDLNLVTTADTDLDLQVTELAYAGLDFTTTTTVTQAAGGDFTTDGFAAGNLIKIIGSSDNDGFYKIASIQDDAATNDEITIDQTGYWANTSFNVTDDSAVTGIIVTEDGVADVTPYDVINVTYLLNPQTGTGDVNITGAWASGTTYALGDVAFDTGNTKTNADGARWYYVSATTGASAGANLNADSGNTWTLWDKASGGGERWVKDGFYAYSVIIDASNAATSGDAKTDSPYTDAGGGTKENIYDWCQWALRQSTFIDVGASRNGNVAGLLTEFVGATLETASGVFIDDLKPVDTNAVVMNDYSGTAHTYPLVVTVTINFNNNLSTDTSAKFYAYYDSVPSGDFGTVTALQVIKSPSGAVGSDITNNVPQNPAGTQYQFSYAYDSDITGGRTISTETDIVVVAIGLITGQYVKATGTITTAGATVSLVAPLERNYSNP